MPSYSREVKIPGKSSQELYDKVAQDIDHFIGKTGVGSFEIDRDPSSKEVSVTSKMFSARLVCRDGAIKVDGQLSLFAMPFKSKIDEGIDRWISKTFG